MSFIYTQEWTLQINAQDTNQEGASDYVIIGTCSTCHDGFHFGEDENDLPNPPEPYTDIQIFRFDWLGEIDENGNSCTDPNFYVDKMAIHEPSELLSWPLTGYLIGGGDDSDSITLNWQMDDLGNEYGIYLYIGDTGYNMRSFSSLTVSKADLATNIDFETTFTETANAFILMGGVCQYRFDILLY